MEAYDDMQERLIFIRCQMKIAKFNKPIVAVKVVEANKKTKYIAYERVHIFFQSTRNCNIQQ